MPELLEYPSFTAHRMSDIRAEIGEGRFRQFDKWMNGQTMPICEDGRADPLGLVYSWDYKRWHDSLAGRPVVFD